MEITNQRKKRKRNKKKGATTPNIDELKLCKHCKSELKPTNIRKLPIKKLPERYGVCWAGIEIPYIQIYKIECSNLSCKKKYSVKHRGSNLLYK